MTPVRCIHCLHPANPTESDPICTECGRRVRGSRSGMYAYIAPIISCTILVAVNTALLVNLGGKRNLEAVAAGLIVGPGGNVLLGLLSLACVPLARRWLRPTQYGHMSSRRS
ncbi:MAG: hypothetical protein SGJ11_04565 [Phycisphaerae bacterium]|nr:hypothetical protein [Phycisphaerae bacterium]